ncbi:MULTISPECIES: alpha/beta hydrolase [Amycolatopsis]|uniref:Alpha/beta hydrolase n=2 Tax=Amycolatopsis TaxID=1813 RepID=A0A1I3MUX8_9PSEU|nr:alpha/beta hydrolase [Amycolatopsis sacchari]SFJ00486.1 Alpha/beta hydrolase [Amycolatopsis sacchari]
MVTWGEVVRWSPAPLAELVGVLNGRYQQLMGCADELRASGVPKGWSGPAANAAATKVRELGEAAEELAAEGAMLRRAAGDVSDAVSGVLNGVREAENLAAAREFLIADDGTIVDQGPPPVCTPSDPDGSLVTAERQRIAAELRDRVHEVLRSADDVDNDFCAVLDRILSNHVIDGDGTSLAAAGNAGWSLGSLTIPAPPPAGAAPADNAAWWATLSPAQRTVLARDHPELIGPRDGLPTEARDHANRVLLDRTRANLAGQRTELQHRIDGLRRTAGGDIVLNDRAAYERLTEQLADIEGKLRGVDAIYDRLNHPVNGQPAYLLKIDADVAGKAIVAAGNPDTAQNVATFVPGTGSGLDDIGGNIQRSDLMLEQARRAGSASTAVITWVGYDAPATIPDAASTRYADQAEQPLHDFQDGLRIAHQGPAAHTTVIGHSYGSTAVGQTARDQGLAADDVVFVGSPGVGVEHADELRLDGVPPGEAGKHVFSSNAPTDPVPALTNFDLPYADGLDPLGPDPTTPWFGGQTFESDPGDPRHSHSQYWDRGSSSLKAMGEIIAGNR